MPDSDRRPPLSRCVVDQWSLQERLESVLYATNTLSGILSLLECGDEPQSTSQVLKRIARNGFGADPDKFDAITYGAIQDKLEHLSDEFALVDSYEETRPPTKGRGGRVQPTEVRVFEKDPRGYWFGDPIAARILATCADLDQAPTDIFTSADKKGETRAPFTTLLLIYSLRAGTTVSEKGLIRDVFWDPTGREEYQELRHRVNKNIERLVGTGLLEKESYQETVLRHTGNDLETYPLRSDDSRIINETDRVESYLKGEGEVHRPVLIENVQTHHTQLILDHLHEDGVVERVRGGMDDRTRISLTERGSIVVDRVVVPIFRAISPEFSFDYETRVEYDQTWHATPGVNESYLEEAYRNQLRTFRNDPAEYQADVATVNRIDKEQNPWR